MGDETGGITAIFVGQGTTLSAATKFKTDAEWGETKCGDGGVMLPVLLESLKNMATCLRRVEFRGPLSCWTAAIKN